jgi:hypothetical protein
MAKTRIKLDPEEKKVSCLNLPINEVPEEFLTAISEATPTYIDTSSMQEHMYSIAVLETLQIEDLDIIEEIEKWCNRYNCSYFRIFNF